jgi:Double zinc ribbon
MPEPTLAGHDGFAHRYPRQGWSRVLGSASLFHSTAFVVAQDLALVCAVLFWLGCAFWTHRDAKRRIDDPLLVWTATLLGLVPLAGPLAYLLFRPPETLADARTRHVELRALETSLERREPLCPVCRAAVESAFLVCPVCTTHLKEPCRACEAPLEPLWQVCPYCRTPVKAPAAVDLEAALTAEAASNSRKKAPAKRPRRAASS